MPQKHAALKALRKDRKRRVRNQANRAQLRTLMKRLLVLLKDQKLDEARTLLRQVTKRYDQAAAKGLVHRNTAARTTSRLTRRINRQQTTP